jgi:uncharacterized protein (TIGR02246 family)
MIVPNSENLFSLCLASLWRTMDLIVVFAKARLIDMSAATEGVTALLAKYNEALNASSTDAVMPLYTEDGVFMPPYSQSAVGAAAVRKAYDAVFKAITLDVKFAIAEIVELGPVGPSHARIPPGRPRTMRPERKARRATRSCLSSRETMTAPGRSRGTAFRRRILLGIRLGSRGRRELF